jgi:hypothetical protein
MVRPNSLIDDDDGDDLLRYLVSARCFAVFCVSPPPSAKTTTQIIFQSAIVMPQKYNDGVWRLAGWLAA